MMLEWIVSSCFLILVVLALRAALGRKLSARFRYALWALVLVRLLVPVQLFTSPVAGMQVNVSERVSERMQEKSIYVLPIDRIPVEDSQGYIISEDGHISSGNSFGYEKLEDKGETIVRYADKISPLQALEALWFTGGAVLALVLLASNLQFSVRLRRVRKPLENAGCPIPLYVAESLPSPCLFGVLRPAVYVTAAAEEDPDMLRHVLAHELTHYRHLDHIWSVLRGLALAIHWWNPLAWLAAVFSRRDGELACDEGALKRLGREERAAYGETLIALVTAKPSPRDLLSCATTMSGEKRSLRERIHRIACESKQLVSAVIAVVVVVSFTSVCAFGRAAEAPSRYDVIPGTLSYLTDLNRDGIQEKIQILEKKADIPEWRLEFNQGDTGIWTVTLDETHGNCGTYFLYRENGADYLLEYMPKMQQGYCTYSYRLFHVEDGAEMTDQEKNIEFDINFAAENHSFDPAEIAAFMNEVNALMGKSKLLLNTNHWMLNLEEDAGGRMYDNILLSLHALQKEYAPGMLLEALEDYAAYGEDHPDDTNSPLADLLVEMEQSDIGDISGQTIITAPELLTLLRETSANRTSRFYDYSRYEDQESWSWSEARWTVPLADGSVLHLDASNKGSAVYITWETPDSAPAAFYYSEKLNQLICEVGESYIQEVLPYTPDLNHDGKPDQLQITVGPDGMSWALQCVGEIDEGKLKGKWSWFQNAYSPHVGWNALFLCKIDGEDYLLQYNPYMGGGVCNYHYKLFYLSGDREVTVQENRVDFDIIFDPDYAEQHVYNPEDIAAFIDEINALLTAEDTVQLLNTDENLLNTFKKEGRLYDSIWWLEDDRDESLSLLENLEVYRDKAEKESTT